MKLYTKYQKPGSSSFTKEFFLKDFPYLGLCKTSDTLDGFSFDPEALI